MRLRSSVVLVALLGMVSGACGAGAGDGNRPPIDTAASTTTAPTTANGSGSMPSSTTGRDDRSTTTARAPERRPATSTTTAAGDGGASGPPATDPEPGSGDVQPTAADDGSQGPPGAFARTLLRPAPATAIVLERAAQPGVAVAPAAVDRSARVLGSVSGKSVDVRPQASVTAGDTDWSADEVRRTADATARTLQGDGRAVLRLLILRGTFEGSEEVLGVAVRGDVVALFADNIAGAATPLVSRQAIEDAVLLHELGHVLGLVDLARNTGRADKEHPGHSSNSASVMYWAVESSLVGQVIGGPPPRDFDAADLADLRALRDGA
ncbi:MAG TPA: hypothetical protein VM933_03880 [Acidimicrobiales bacterium]|nr:hypothetical protein [Acidimicrobiales bacterium]